jgi:hypothetical protein
MHCVRGYGHLLQLFSGLTKQPESCPTKVMLHSYGGSVEEIPKFCKLRGIGDRFYFSFSHAINARTPEKLAARIAAVPDDRLLIESDQVSTIGTLRAMAAVVGSLPVLAFLPAVLRNMGFCSVLGLRTHSLLWAAWSGRQVLSTVDKCSAVADGQQQGSNHVLRLQFVFSMPNMLLLLMMLSCGCCCCCCCGCSSGDAAGDRWWSP